MSEKLPKFLDDPGKYCERITSLFDTNSEEWQELWKAAIPELWTLSSTEISVINVLLKPVETAFKSKDSRLRIQAFECWSYFIIHYEKLSASEKLCNVLLTPLIACNHSLYVVLKAKLKTWNTLVGTNLITHPKVMKKAVLGLLKFLYGPHTLNPVSSFNDLSDSCGQIYHKLMMKCIQFDETREIIFNYLERAIPPLSNQENTQKLAKLIWSDALKIISEEEWPKNYFASLMRTFENLISDHTNNGFQLLNNFLSILINIYGSFPPDRLTPHMNLIIRCLFNPPINMTFVTNIMDRLLKLSEQPTFFFQQLEMVLSSSSEMNKDVIDKLWIAVATCYTKWLKNNDVNESEPPNYDYSVASKILLFPFVHMSELDEGSLAAVQKQWKMCYEQCLSSADNHQDKFLQIFLQKLEQLVENVPNDSSNIVSKLIIATSICKAILSCAKYSAKLSYLKPVLLTLSKKMPPRKKLTDANLKSLVVKYIVTVLCYVKLVPGHSEEFSSFIKNFGSLVPKEYNDEFIALQTVSKPNDSKSDGDSNDSVKIIDDVDICLNTKSTPVGKTKLRTSFLERLSPANRKPDNLESPNRLPCTPKSNKITIDDDVQFIEIKTKPKNSPMTEHQREVLKEKHYIPALYQDLSQSHSQSDSVSLLTDIRKTNTSIKPDLFEENANLPPTNESVTIVPASLSFKSSFEVSGKSKKALFAEKEESEKIIASENEENESNKQNENENPSNKDSEKSTNKRKSLRGMNKMVDLSPKRTRRVSSKLQFDGIVPDVYIKSTKPVDSKKRRSKASVAVNSENKIEVINLTDSESQNIFVSTSNSRTVTPVSSPLSSLINVKDPETGSNSKRKSLRSKGLSARSSPISTRKRKSTVVEENSKLKQASFPGDSAEENAVEKENPKSAKNGINEFEKSDAEVLDNITEFAAKGVKRSKQEKILNSDRKSENLTHEEQNKNSEKEPMSTDVEVKNLLNKDIPKPSNANDVSTSKELVSDSVIIVEQTSCEVISLEDSDCAISTEKKSNPELVTSTKIKSSEDISDDSTFFEGSVNQIKPVESNVDRMECENTKTEDVPKSNAIITEQICEAQNENISPEIISSEESFKKIPESNSHKGVDIQETVSDHESASLSILNKPSSSSGSISILEKTPIPQKSNEEIVEVDSSDNLREAEDQNDNHSATNTEVTSISEEELNSEKLAEEKTNPNSSPISNNSRSSQMLKLANAQNLARSPKQTRMYSKPGKRPRTNTGGSIAQFLKNTPNRASQIIKLLADVENECPVYTTPNKIMASPVAEKLKYFPKECTSPGILKKTDANQTASPKSSKFVNFADQLTATREFYKDDCFETDSLISTGDENLGSNNLMNNDDIRSQDMLYSQLQNCRDDIKNVVEHIFSSSWCKQALNYLNRMDINTVGQLAGMSIVSAKSIPAGDNRVARLRRGLRKYDEITTSEFELKGLRKPSARRKILKTSQECKSQLEISCLADLLNEAELVDKYLSDDETEENLPNTETSENPTTEGSILSENPTTDGSILSENNCADNASVSESTLNSPIDDIIPADKKPDKTVHNIVAIEEVVDNPPQTDLPAVDTPLPVQGEPVENPADQAEKLGPESEPEPEQMDKTENKENLDPSKTDDHNPSETAESLQPESMEVEAKENGGKNECENDSMDYICTDSGKAYDEDSTDRRSITMKNMHKYSTIMESPESVGVLCSTNKPNFGMVSEDIVIVDSDDSINTSQMEGKSIGESQTGVSTVEESGNNSVSIFSPVNRPQEPEACQEVESVSQSLIEESKNAGAENVSVSQSSIQGSNKLNFDLRSHIQNIESEITPDDESGKVAECNSEVSVIVERSTVVENSLPKEIAVTEGEQTINSTVHLQIDNIVANNLQKWRVVFSEILGTHMASIVMKDVCNEEQAKECFLELVKHYNRSLSTLNLELNLKDKN